MLSFKNDVPQSVDVLGDMLLNSKYSKYHVDAEKDTIWQELQATNDDHFETLMENVYSNVYRDHMMGLPILGEINNIHKITREMIVEFHSRMYYGENMTIIGTGNIEHQMLVDLAEKNFGKLQRTNGGTEILNMEKPKFTPGLLYVRDDAIQNQNLGVFFNAPSWRDPDFFAFLLI
jgi:processing peptidase subunit beta